MQTEQYVFLVADGQPLFRASLQQSVSDNFPDSTIELVDDLDLVRKSIKQHKRADMLMLDLTMPGVEGFTGLIMLLANFRKVPVLVVLDTDSPKVISKAIEHGAAGVLMADSSAEEVYSAIECVMHGGVWIPADVGMNQGHLSQDEETAAWRVGKLTPQQFRVASALASGMFNKQLAKTLGMPEGVVKKQLESIYKKLGVASRKQAVLELNRLHLLLNATTTTIQ